MMRRLTRLGGAAVLVLVAAGCGKKGDLDPVEGSELYKNTYPAPESMTPDGEDEASP